MDELFTVLQIKRLQGVVLQGTWAGTVCAHLAPHMDGSFHIRDQM